MTREQITEAMDLAAADVHQWFNTHGPTRWTFAPEGKWTAGQHLEHLVRSIKPLCKALGAPKIALRLSFGKPNRPVRALEEVQAKYRKGLAGGFTASGAFIPPPVTESDIPALLNEYLALHSRLNKVLKKWSEPALDAHLLPHPALGKMMIREILYFTIIHTRHHLQILVERYE